MCVSALEAINKFRYHFSVALYKHLPVILRMGMVSVTKHVISICQCKEYKLDVAVFIRGSISTVR